MVTRVLIGEPNPLKPNAQQLIGSAYGEAAFPLDVLFVNHSTRKLVFPEVDLLLEPSPNAGSSKTVAVDSLSELQRVGSSIEEVAQSLHYDPLMGLEAEGSGEQPPVINDHTFFPSGSGPVVFNSLGDRPAANTFGLGQCIILTNTYSVLSTSNGLFWYSQGFSESLNNRPAATLFGSGTWQVNGLLYVSDGSGWSVDCSEYHSIALEASAIVKNTGGKLVGITGHNNSSSAQYIQVHDASALPANGAAPTITFRADPKADFIYPLKEPYPFDDGIVICNSSTLSTKTIGSADCWFNVLFK